MKTLCSLLMLGCLVTSTSVSFAATEQEDEESGMTLMNCEQEAQEMGISGTKEIADYVRKCEEAFMPGHAMDEDMDEQAVEEAPATVQE